MNFLLMYRRGAGAEFTTLEPGVHQSIYSRPEVKNAIEHMRAHDEVIGVVVQVPAGDTADQFNILRLPDGSEHPSVFKTKK